MDTASSMDANDRLPPKKDEFASRKTRELSTGSCSSSSVTSAKLASGLRMTASTCCTTRGTIGSFTLPAITS